MGKRQKRAILVVSNDLVGDNRVHKVACTLVKANYRVLIVGRKLPQSAPLTEQPYQTRRLCLLCNTGALFYAELNVRFFFLLLFARYDVATANDLDTLPAAYLATKIRRKKLVYDSHEYFTEVPELVNRPRVQNVWLGIEKRTFPKLNRCMTVCKSIAEIYAAKYHVLVDVVQNFPFRMEQKPPLANLQLPSSKVILYQGTLNVHRGLDMLIASMVHMPDFCLLIVGDGPMGAALEQQVRDSQLEQRVLFVGQVAQEEVAAYTQLATLGVSLEDDVCANYHFALPNKLFDYIQAEKPVLVSNVPEMAAIVQKYGCGEVVTNREPQALATQIVQMCNDASLLDKYKVNSKKAAQELCWENQEEKLLQVYER